MERTFGLPVLSASMMCRLCPGSRAQFSGLRSQYSKWRLQEQDCSCKAEFQGSSHMGFKRTDRSLESKQDQHRRVG